jgi:hypothetical protein
MQKLTLIRKSTSILKLLYGAIFLLLASWRIFAQAKTTISVKDAKKAEERYLEAADGSMRVVKVVTAVDGQYFECSGEGPKERFKGPASCSPTPPGVNPGTFSFDIKIASSDSLIIHARPGNQLNQLQLQLQGGGQIILPNTNTIKATLQANDKIMLKSSS